MVVTMKSSDMSCYEAALKYAKTGWRIFPCKPRTKVPLTTKGVKDATTDEAVIKAWWQRWPDANVAVACGDESGIYVVDVDIKPDASGWDSVADKNIPATVMQHTPGGGAHFLFKCDNADKPTNKNNFLPAVDIRCTGYYIVLPPSIHPNGKTYKWTDGAAPWELELAEFPLDFYPKKNLLPWDAQTKPLDPPKIVVPDEPDRILERARLYLAECAAAVQGSNGHDALLWAATAMVVGFQLDDTTALGLLWSDYNPRCVPPWNSNSPSEVKDFERKVKEAKKSKKPSGWLLQEHGLINDPELVRLGAEIAEALAGNASIIESEPTEEDASSNMDEEYPEWLMNPAGLVGRITAYINETAGCPQPLLSLGAAFTACGAIMGRKIRDESNGRTNLYMMGVAHSSAGKDHPADCIEQIFGAAGITDLLGGSRVTSDTAIEVALENNPVQLFNWDEIGHMLTSIKQASSGNAPHLRTIVPALMQLYSSPHKVYVGKQRADADVRRIDQPHVCVWGLTSPDVLYAGLSTAELRDGWLGRVITLISHRRPRYAIKIAKDPPQDVVYEVQTWAQRAITPDTSVGDIRAATIAQQILVPTSGSAMSIFSRFGEECYNEMLQCDKDNDMTQYLWGKALQNARRIALVYAAGCAFDNAEIQEHHARYACEFVRFNIDRFRQSIESHLSDNIFEADKQKIYSMILKTGRKGMPKREITRRTQWLKDRRIRDEYLADLVEGGLILPGANPLDKGRVYYWATKYAREGTE